MPRIELYAPPTVELEILSTTEVRAIPRLQNVSINPKELRKPNEWQKKWIKIASKWIGKNKGKNIPVTIIVCGSRNVKIHWIHYFRMGHTVKWLIDNFNFDNFSKSTTNLSKSFFLAIQNGYFFFLFSFKGNFSGSFEIIVNTVRVQSADLAWISLYTTAVHRLRSFFIYRFYSLSLLHWFIVQHSMRVQDTENSIPLLVKLHPLGWKIPPRFDSIKRFLSPSFSFSLCLCRSHD